VSWLKGQDSGEDIKIRSLVEYFSTPLPDPQIRRLRRIWNQHRTDSKTLLEALRIFVADNPVLKVDRPTIADMQEEDLALVCYMALV
jgi:hypothetical protein